MGKITLPIAAEKVVPHRSPMSLLRHVIKHDAGSTTCDVLINSHSLFLEKGRVGAWVGLEYMAQAVAAHAGMASRQLGKPPEIGFWIGTRRADFFTDGYRIGQTLQVVARHVWGEGELFSFDCSITGQADGALLAKAQLNVFRPADVERIFKGKKT